MNVYIEDGIELRCEKDINSMNTIVQYLNGMLNTFKYHLYFFRTTNNNKRLKFTLIKL